MVSLHRVDGRTVARAVGLHVDLPVVAMVAMDGETALAAWGLAWGQGKCWMWFHIEQPKPEYRFIVMREARKMLKRAVQLGETEVFTVRDVNYPSSLKLLKILGFEPYSVEGAQEIWRKL